MTVKGLILATLAVLSLLAAPSTAAWGFGSPDPGKVRLRDVQVLTLHAGKMTTGRRSSPVPQLTCVGGSAAGQFTPSVVQCYNRGSDGVDVQWECKADMDSSFRFGSVEVVCEGYDYPDDPYITRGSCGLEYTIDYTDGHNHHKQSSSGGWGWFSSSPKTATHSAPKSSSGGFGDLIVLLVIGVVIYALYVTCLSGNDQQMGDRQYSTTNDDHPGGTPGFGGGWHSPRSGPSYPGTSSYSQGHQDAGCGAANDRASRPGTGGFWTGMAAGGLLGYMAGNSGSSTRYRSPPTYGSTWTGGSTGSSWAGSSGSSSPSPSGTHTSSGFGGTRRR